MSHPFQQPCSQKLQKSVFLSAGRSFPVVRSFCSWQVQTAEEYIQKGPNFIFLFNPCLGPLWEVISHKIQGGNLEAGSELVLEIAEAYVSDLNLDGSLVVHASSVAGHRETVNHTQHSNGTRVPASKSMGVQCADARLASDCCTPTERIIYSEKCGRILLERVNVVNQGVDWFNKDNVYWQHKVARSESMHVHLHGCSEFHARDVTISGDYLFEVPDGFKMEVMQGNNGDIIQNLIALDLKESWHWKYELTSSHAVKLSLQG